MAFVGIMNNIADSVHGAPSRANIMPLVTTNPLGSTQRVAAGGSPCFMGATLARSEFIYDGPPMGNPAQSRLRVPLTIFQPQGNVPWPERIHVLLFANRNEREAMETGDPLVTGVFEDLSRYVTLVDPEDDPLYDVVWGTQSRPFYFASLISEYMDVNWGPAYVESIYSSGVGYPGTYGTSAYDGFAFWHNTTGSEEEAQMFHVMCGHMDECRACNEYSDAIPNQEIRMLVKNYVCGPACTGEVPPTPYDPTLPQVTKKVPGSPVPDPQWEF